MPGRCMLAKLFNQIDYLFKETLTGLRRAGWMNWAAVSVLTIALFLFGLGWQGVQYVEQGLRDLGAQLEITAYLKPKIQGVKLTQRAEAIPGVNRVDVITSKEYLPQAEQEMGLKEDLTDLLGENPFVDFLRLQVDSAAAIDPVAQEIRSWQEVSEVRYGSEAAAYLQQIKEALSLFGLGLVSLLGLAATAVVTSTIGLVVSSRRREIEVMQLVGAAPHWVYLPFILEGLVLGALGAGLAWSLLQFTGFFLQEQLQTYVPFMPLPDLLAPNWYMPLLLAGLGLGLGSLGSALAVIRYWRR